MNLLVFNAGSSSLKFRLYDTSAGDLRLRTSGAVNAIGARAEWRWDAGAEQENAHPAVSDHAAATRYVLQWVHAHGFAADLGAVGHRVVHGADRFHEPTWLDDDALARLEPLNALAQLHNPPALAVVRACRAQLGPGLPQAAVFDTAFHATLPPPAREYALPAAWVSTYGLRRYGFHGIAHRYMYERYCERYRQRETSTRVISLQLGHGCSVAAVRDARSVETSMGYAPLEGLIMSTRCGDVDAGALLALVPHVTADAMALALSRASGLLALSGVSGDMRELLALETQGHDGARRAIAAFCHRARKYLGAYLAVLGGADAVLFGGGIGEHAPSIRARICADMQWCGLRLDPDANTDAVGVERCLSAPGSPPAVYAIAVDEELLIARDTHALLQQHSN